MARWSRRQSGEVRTTIRVTYHVPKDIVDWLCKNLDWSESRALTYIRSHVGILGDNWHTIFIEEGEPLIAHVDEVKDLRRDGRATSIYEGPTIV